MAGEAAVGDDVASTALGEHDLDDFIDQVVDDVRRFAILGRHNMSGSLINSSRILESFLDQEQVTATVLRKGPDLVDTRREATSPIRCFEFDDRSADVLAQMVLDRRPGQPSQIFLTREVVRTPHRSGDCQAMPAAPSHEPNPGLAADEHDWLRLGPQIGRDRVVKGPYELIQVHSPFRHTGTRGASTLGRVGVRDRHRKASALDLRERETHTLVETHHLRSDRHDAVPGAALQRTNEIARCEGVVDHDAFAHRHRERHRRGMVADVDRNSLLAQRDLGGVHRLEEPVNQWLDLGGVELLEQAAHGFGGETPQAEAYVVSRLTVDRQQQRHRWVCAHAL